MFRKVGICFAVGGLIALLLAAATDILLGPATSVRADGQIVGAKLFSVYFFHWIVGLFLNLGLLFKDPVSFIQFFNSEPVALALFARLLVILMFSVFFSWVYIFKISTKTPDARHVSGMRLLTGEQANADAKRQLANESDNNRHRGVPRIELAPGVHLTPHQETRGFFLEGGTGSGKTVIIESLLRQAIERRDKIVLYDIKGDFAPKIERRLVLNPFAAETAVWAVARDVKTADQARQLARMLIPSDKGTDTFWDSAAHTVLSGILISLQAEKSGHWTFRDVWRLLLSPRETVIEKLKAHYPLAAVFFADKAGASNLEQGVLATVAARLSPLIESLAIAWGNPDDQAAGFSFETWLLSEDAEPRTLILQGSPEHQDAASAWIRMAINYLAGLLVSPRVENDGPLRLWLILDELYSLGQIPRLTDIVDRGRQKGVRAVVACQSLAQIALHYGEWAQSAESTFGTRIFGKMSPGERTQAIIRSLGERYVEEMQVTKTRNADGSTSRAVRPNSEKRLVLSPEVFGSLGKQGSQGIDALIVGLTPNVLRARWPFPPKKPNFHPSFKTAVLDRSVLSMPEGALAPTSGKVSKSFGLKLDDALDRFDKDTPPKGR